MGSGCSTVCRWEGDQVRPTTKKLAALFAALGPPVASQVVTGSQITGLVSSRGLIYLLEAVEASPERACLRAP